MMQVQVEQEPSRTNPLQTAFLPTIPPRLALLDSHSRSNCVPIGTFRCVPIGTFSLRPYRDLPLRPHRELPLGSRDPRGHRERGCARRSVAPLLQEGAGRKR